MKKNDTTTKIVEKKYRKLILPCIYKEKMELMK